MTPRSPRPAKPKKKKGRPTSLTPEVQAAICKSLSQGVWFAHAAEGAGISRESGKEWLKLGQGFVRDSSTRKWVRVAKVGPEPFASFALAVREAKANANISEQRRIASADDWRAAAYLQERRNPKVFGERLRIEVDAKVQKSLDAFLKDMEHDLTPDAYAQLVNAVSKRMGIQPGGGS